MPPQNQFATVPSLVSRPMTPTSTPVAGPPRKTAAERLAEIRAEKAAQLAATPPPPAEKGFLRSLGEAIVKPVLTTGANIQYGVGKAASAVAGAVGADSVKQNFDSDLARMRNQGVIGGFVRPDDTAGKVLGNALQSASLVVGGGAAPSAVRQGFIKGVGAATKAYAPLGAASGAAAGAGASLAEGNTDPLKIAGDTAVGTVLGAAAAPVLGGVGGAIASSARKGVQKTFGKTLDAISPKLTPTEMKAAISAGRGTVSGLTKRVGIDFSKDPVIAKAARAVQGVVKPGAPATENVNRVISEISRQSEEVVRPFLNENPVPVNFADFRKKLTLVNPSTSLKADKAAYTTYTRVREEILDDVANFLRAQGKPGTVTDMNDFWDARKIIDAKIARELGESTFESPAYTGAKAAAQDIRKAFSDYISDALEFPGQMEKVNTMQDFLQTFRARGGQIPNETEGIRMLVKQFGLSPTEAGQARAAFFRDNMSRLASMYDAVDSMTTKAYREVGTSAIKRATSSGVGKTVRDVGIGLAGFGGAASAVNLLD